jgi:hypothetical protein
MGDHLSHLFGGDARNRLQFEGAQKTVAVGVEFIEAFGALRLNVRSDGIAGGLPDFTSALERLELTSSGRRA